MFKLQAFSNKGHGWLLVLHSMVNVIPINEPLGPAVITLVLDDCPLPAKVFITILLLIYLSLNEKFIESNYMCDFQDSITKVPRMFWLSGKASKRGKSDPTRHRNICISLGCIAEKLAGPASVALLTDSTLDYLIANLVSLTHVHIFIVCIAMLKCASHFIVKNDFSFFFLCRM